MQENKRQKSHCVANLAVTLCDFKMALVKWQLNFGPCNFGLKSYLWLQIELDRAARSFDFEITRMILDQIALHSVQIPLYSCLDKSSDEIDFKKNTTLLSFTAIHISAVASTIFSMKWTINSNEVQVLEKITTITQSFKLTCLTCALSVSLSRSMCNASLILRANHEDAWSIIATLSWENAELHANELFRCLKIREALSVSKCSLTRVLKHSLHTRIYKPHLIGVHWAG